MSNDSSASPLRVYVASSWRNLWQPAVVEYLRTAGCDVYDFRHPEPGDEGFHWSEIDQDWQEWSPPLYIQALKHPVAVHGFDVDMAALRECDACVLVQPCGKSAHLELGWAVGAGRRTAIILDREGFEPELMYRMVDLVTDSPRELLRTVRRWQEQREPIAT